jgi:hypothetical protein
VRSPGWRLAQHQNFLAQCLYVAIRHAPSVPFRHNEKRACVSHPDQAASTIVARSGEAKVGAGVTFYFRK